MDDTIIQMAFVRFFGGALAGILIGGLVAWRRGAEAGIGTGCLVIGLVGLLGAAHAGWHRWHAIAATAEAQGVLVATASDLDTAGRPPGESRGPVVRFTTPDGQTHRVTGLGGSQSQRHPGNAVPVRYPPDDPSAAVIADFQHLWGGVGALVLFGTMPTLFGLYFLVGAGREDTPAGGARPARRTRPPASRSARTKSKAHETSRAGATSPVRAPSRTRREHLAAHLTRGGNLMFAGSFVVLLLDAGSLARSLGFAFSTIAGACLLYVLACRAGGERGGAAGIFAIVGVAFLMFGVGILLLA
jgi:hypothetical protein